MADAELAAPFAVQVVADETAVTMVRLVFGAEEAGSGQILLLVSAFDPAVGHQIEKVAPEDLLK